MECNEQRKENGDLTGREDGNVTAGSANPFGVRTMMHCDKCNFELVWAGEYYYDAEVFNCPHCHAHAFHGIYLC